jgi:cytochrome c peroxidase
MALAVYVGSLAGMNSEFDKYIKGELSQLNPSVKNGFNLFMGKAVCGTCHFAPVFNGTVPPDYKESESEVLGVPENPYVKKPTIDSDEGRGKALLKDKVFFNKYAFKTPTVRNVKLTFPYMHNGSYKTLNDVVDFYNKGGGKGIGIVLEHQTLPFDELKLSKKEMNDIVSFMESLTDTIGLTSKPKRLPTFRNNAEWNNRKIGGEY